MRALFYSGDDRNYLVSMEIDYVIIEDDDENVLEKNLSFRGFNVIEGEDAEKEIYYVHDIENGTAASLIEQAAYSGILDLRTFEVL